MSHLISVSSDDLHPLSITLAVRDAYQQSGWSKAAEAAFPRINQGESNDCEEGSQGESGGCGEEIIQGESDGCMKKKVSCETAK